MFAAMFDCAGCLVRECHTAINNIKIEVCMVSFNNLEREQKFFNFRPASQVDFCVMHCRCSILALIFEKKAFTSQTITCGQKD